MAKLAWDQTGERVYENGVDRGVLYLPNASGVYDSGFAWNGLTTVTESPSGAESNKQYADNRVYANLYSVEEFGGTIEAFTYPDEWAECDGSATLQAGVYVGQQQRKSFGLAYRTKVGNDLNSDAGYKIHLVYGAMAAPSEKAYATVNDSPEAMGLSWEFSTTPMDVGTIGGKDLKPTASMVVDSTKVDAAALSDLEDALYGTLGQDPRLPTPAEVYAMFSGTVTTVTPTQPTYNSTTDIVTIPSITGVVYYIDGVKVDPGPYGPITQTVVASAQPAPGYEFPDTADDDWTITFS
jgi:hypothetical protein